MKRFFDVDEPEVIPVPALSQQEAIAAIMSEPEPGPEVLQIDIRPATSGDVAWIYSSWLKNFRDYGSGVRHIPHDVYYHAQRERIRRVTSRPGVHTLIACPSENSEQILGWLSGERFPEADTFVAYYGHVKSERRRQGIMRALVGAFDVRPSTTCFYTHHTRFSERGQRGELGFVKLREVVPTWHYNPYLFE